MRVFCFIVAGLFAMLTGPSVLAANCDGFTDVDSANSTYCSAVTYLKDKGITLGCTGTQYCPNDYVTRLQMALFLQRMGRGGADNQLFDYTATVGGGVGNVTSGSWSVVSGGVYNSAAAFSVVSGGYNNSATAFGGSVIGGQYNVAAGVDSSVIGGHGNSANGQNSVAAGRLANADQDYCMVLDFWDTSTPMTCLGSANIVRIGDLHGLSVDYYSQRPDGGGTKWVAIGDTAPSQTIATWTGGYLSDGGTWTNSSDRNAKTDVTLIDPQSVLDRVAAMPIATWRYKTETDQVHLGPMAQDFRAAFGLGADDKHIATIDEGGVALAAIQGLNAKLEAVVAQQAQELAQQSHDLAEIKAQLAAIVATH